MIMSIIPFLTISLSLIPLTTNNPLVLAITILCISITLIIWIRLTLTSWIIIVIFLIYVGGIIVAISYFLALNPNLKLNILKESFITACVSLRIFIMSSNTTYTLKLHGMRSPRFIIRENRVGILWLILLILFLALVIAVTITKSRSGPIRPYRI